MEKLRDLCVKWTILPKVEVGDLLLNFLHHIDLTLEKLCHSAEHLIADLWCLFTRICSFNLIDEGFGNSFPRAGNDEIQELFVTDDRLFVLS